MRNSNIGTAIAAFISFVGIQHITYSCSCTTNSEDKETKQIKQAAKNFADCYFNYSLNEAKRYCTPESGEWLAFLASNITQADIDVVNRQDEDAKCEITDIEIENDTAAIAVCEMRNIVMPDTLDRPVSARQKATYKIRLVQRRGQWLVKMEGLPQSER